jgi:hypothetical protein
MGLMPKMAIFETDFFVLGQEHADTAELSNSKSAYTLSFRCVFGEISDFHCGLFFIVDFCGCANFPEKDNKPHIYCPRTQL